MNRSAAQEGVRVMEPLRFERVPVPRVWGGRALERTPGIRLNGTDRIGETWELSDRADTNSVVAEGPDAGRSLRELMLANASGLLGRSRASRNGTFPLLIKLLDATDRLSVQVHPHPTTSKPGEECKTESWYILAAEPGSFVYLGLAPGVDRAALAKAAGKPEIVELLMRFEVKPGEFVFVPGGTVHAITEGITLVEVQENADVTYRFYDWGRDRPLQIEDALRVTRYGTTTRGPFVPESREIARGVSRAPLVDCDEFAVELLELSSALDCDARGVAVAYTSVSGSGAIASAREGATGEWRIRPGDTWLVPASFGAHRIEARGELRLLRSTAKA
jgi:mannose-6-phosphate isomerase